MSQQPDQPHDFDLLCDDVIEAFVRDRRLSSASALPSSSVAAASRSCSSHSKPSTSASSTVSSGKASSSDAKNKAPQLHTEISSGEGSTSLSCLRTVSSPRTPDNLRSMSSQPFPIPAESSPETTGLQIEGSSLNAELLTMEPCRSASSLTSALSSNSSLHEDVLGKGILDEHELEPSRGTTNAHELSPQLAEIDVGAESRVPPQETEPRAAESSARESSQRGWLTRDSMEREAETKKDPAGPSILPLAIRPLPSPSPMPSPRPLSSGRAPIATATSPPRDKDGLTLGPTATSLLRIREEVSAVALRLGETLAMEAQALRKASVAGKSHVAALRSTLNELQALLDEEVALQKASVAYTLAREVAAGACAVVAGAGICSLAAPAYVALVKAWGLGSGSGSGSGPGLSIGLGSNIRGRSQVTLATVAGALYACSWMHGRLQVIRENRRRERLVHVWTEMSKSVSSLELSKSSNDNHHCI